MFISVHLSNYLGENPRTDTSVVLARHYELCRTLEMLLLLQRTHSLLHKRQQQLTCTSNTYRQTEIQRRICAFVHHTGQVESQSQSVSGLDVPAHSSHLDRYVLHRHPLAANLRTTPNE